MNTTTHHPFRTLLVAVATAATVTACAEQAPLDPMTSTTQSAMAGDLPQAGERAGLVQRRGEGERRRLRKFGGDHLADESVEVPVAERGEHFLPLVGRRPEMTFGEGGGGVRKGVHDKNFRS